MTRADAGSIDRPVLWASLAALLFYLAVAGATLSHVGLSADSVSAWATVEPHRTVLCVVDASPPRMLVAAEPSLDDFASTRARLTSTQRSVEVGPVALHLRDHTYSAVLSVFGVEIPWMKNDYTAGWTDLPAHWAWSLFRTPRAGQATHIAMGGFVLMLACLIAGRLGGWPAALVCGAWLATDSWFLVYKRLVGGYEVSLQLFAVLATALLVGATLRRDRRLLVAAMFVVGLGLHTKPSFLAVAGGLALVAPVVLWGWTPRPDWRRGLALGVAALALGLLPTLAYWAVDAAAPRTAEHIRGNETAGGRLLALRIGTDRKRDDVKSRTTAIDVMLDPGGYWEQHWTIIGAMTDRARPEPSRRERGLPERALVPITGLLLLGVLLGVGVLARKRAEAEPRGEERLAMAVTLLAVVLPFLLRALSPDPHHLALWVPFAAIALGVTLGTLARTPWVLSVIIGLGIVMLPGRLLVLGGIDEDLVQAAGRLSIAQDQARLAHELDRLEIHAPAFLDYNVMSMLDGWSGGAVRPWLYSRASLGARNGCLHGSNPAFLRQILRAHLGGHIVIVAGPNSGPGGRPDPYRSSAEMHEAAAGAGLAVKRVSSLDDTTGKWMATIWAVRSSPATHR